jgi:two-component system NtrC family sensor kinase
VVRSDRRPEYSEKLYKQAQRTHRIVQNLLSFARQHKPERVPVRLNQVLEDTLALRDYDLAYEQYSFAPELQRTCRRPRPILTSCSRCS